MPSVLLDGPADFAGWRKAARGLVAQGVPPSEIVWHTDPGEADLFGGQSVEAPANDAGFSVPRAFVDLAAHAALHRAPERFTLLYRLLWRLRGEPRLMQVASDADVAQVGLLARNVRRDIHKMHAFVRFRSVQDSDAERYVAWYEPDHHVVIAATPFFARRFANMNWAILTPEQTAIWDCSTLRFGPGASIADAPTDDAIEDLWKGYYGSIFNPARVNPTAMRAEMPKHFWKNLPEAALIKPLIEGAPTRTRAMIASAPTFPVLRKGAEIVAEAEAPIAGGFDGLRKAALACKACPLWEPATQTVFGEGPAKARIMLVGEQPGDMEDLAGKPFVGPAGQMLDRALTEGGVERGDAYVTNAVKHFKFLPRGKKRIHQKPNTLEIHACHPWLERELELVEPEVVVALGATAAQAIFGRAMAIGANRGRLVEFGGRQVLITAHPSYLLRLPDAESRQREYENFVADLRLLSRFTTIGR